MKELPILFSAPMVRAILEGRKTQTRRIVKNHEPCDCGDYTPVVIDNGLICDKCGWGAPYAEEGDYLFKCPYGQPGERLWVRETWAALPEYDHLPPSQCDNRGLWYRATTDSLARGYESCHGKWRQSIHMPRWASRINLEITGICVQRLQDMTEADALAEGIEFNWDGRVPEYTEKSEFRELWKSINGPESWDANPWVWVVGFKQVRP